MFEAALTGTLENIVPRLELGHTEAIKKAVEAGLGVGCLSRLAVQRELDHGWLIEVNSPLKLNRPLTDIVTSRQLSGTTDGGLSENTGKQLRTALRRSSGLNISFIP